MKRLTIFSIAGSAFLLASAGVATAQHHHDGAPTFTTEHREMLHQHFRHQHYSSFRDPHFHAHVGDVVPDAMELHPLPDTLATRVPHGSHYGYGLLNERPVIVDHSTRRVIHHFD